MSFLYSLRTVEKGTFAFLYYKGVRSFLWTYIPTMPLNRQTWKFLETYILPTTIPENYPFSSPAPTPEIKPSKRHIFHFPF